MSDISTLLWAPEADENRARPLRILLVEDTQINAEAMKVMAKRLAVEMDTAENGLDAIQMVAEADAAGRPYTLMMTDVMMPVLDGVETTKRLRELGFGPDTLPIVAVTAATSFDEIRSYRAAGIQAFLAKPVSLKDFSATLEAWGHRTGSRNSAERSVSLRELAEQFRERNIRTLKLIEDTLAQAEIDKDRVSEIRHLLHQIAGTATTFGNRPLSESARYYENALLQLNSDTNAPRAVLEETYANLRKRITL